LDKGQDETGKRKETLLKRFLMFSNEISSEVTNIEYVKDIGLIATGLNGTLKFYDGVDFEERWCYSNKDRKTSEHISITAMDFSQKLGL
jgi:hypothetical protein